MQIHTQPSEKEEGFKIQANRGYTVRFHLKKPRAKHPSAEAPANRYVRCRRRTVLYRMKFPKTHMLRCGPQSGTVTGTWDLDCPLLNRKPGRKKLEGETD